MNTSLQYDSFKKVTDTHQLSVTVTWFTNCFRRSCSLLISRAVFHEGYLDTAAAKKERNTILFFHIRNLPFLLLL